MEELTYSTRQPRKFEELCKKYIQTWKTLPNVFRFNLPFGQEGKVLVLLLNITTLTELWQEMDLFYEITWECSKDGRKYDKMIEKESV